MKKKTYLRGKLLFILLLIIIFMQKLPHKNFMIIKNLKHKNVIFHVPFHQIIYLNSSPHITINLSGVITLNRLLHRYTLHDQSLPKAKGNFPYRAFDVFHSHLYLIAILSIFQAYLSVCCLMSSSPSSLQPARKSDPSSNLLGLLDFVLISISSAFLLSLFLLPWHWRPSPLPSLLICIYALSLSLRIWFHMSFWWD